MKWKRTRGVSGVGVAPKFMGRMPGGRSRIPRIQDRLIHPLLARRLLSARGRVSQAVRAGNVAVRSSPAESNPCFRDRAGRLLIPRSSERAAAVGNIIMPAGRPSPRPPRRPIPSSRVNLRLLNGANFYLHRFRGRILIRSSLWVLGPARGLLVRPAPVFLDESGVVKALFC